MAVSIQLLGVPQAVLPDGTVAVRCGHKAWGLLLYLVTHEGAVSRQHLARLLFEDAERGIAALLDTLQRCGRLPDADVWSRAYELDSLCTLAITQGDDRGRAWVDPLTAISSRTGMRERVARSHGHRARLGDPGTAEGSRLLAKEIGNPVLDTHLADVSGARVPFVVRRSRQ